MLSSCSFLDQMPTTKLVSENVFTSESTAKSACLGIYSQPRYSLLRSNFTQSVDNSTVFAQNGRSQNSVETIDLTLYSTNSSNQAVYSEAYNGVAEVNQFLEGVKASKLPESLKLKYEGEGRIIRALWYFHLTRLYGSVPLVLTMPKTADESNIPRAPYQQVYKVILDDLDFGFEHAYTWAELGEEGILENRVCNYAAKALKVKVLVQMACLVQYADDQWFNLAKEGRYPDFSNCGFACTHNPEVDAKLIWQKAYSEAKDVIENGPFDLEPDFWALFRFDFDNPEIARKDALTKEKIITFSSTLKTGSVQWVSRSMPKYPYGCNETSNNANSQCQAPTRYLWECWNKKYGTDNLMYANSTASYAPFEEPDAQGVLKKGNYHYYTECRDPRISTTFVHTHYQLYSDAEHSSIKDVNCYPSSGNIVTKDSDNPSTNCLPQHRKGFSSKYQGTNTAVCEFYYLRFSDVLLLAAECAAELGETENAVAYVNRVLKRARQSTSISEEYPHEFGDGESSEPADWDAADYQDKDYLIHEIMYERVYELEHELHDWFDMRRRGARYMIDNYIHPKNVFDQQNANYGYMHTMYNGGGRLHPEDYSTVRKVLLLPLPDYELRYNTAIGYANQNDFYIQ